MTDQPPKRSKPRQPSRGGEADPEQYARFLAKARDLGCDENTERLDEVVRRAAKLPPERGNVTRTRKGKRS